MKKVGIFNHEIGDKLKNIDHLTKKTDGVPVVTIGLDHGNGYGKGYSSVGLEMIIPAAYATRNDKTFQDADNELKPSKDLHIFRSQRYNENDIDYLVGAAITKATNPISTYVPGNRYTREDYLKLTEFMVCLLLGKEAKNNPIVVMTVGVPSEDKEDDTVTQLKRDLLGEHTVIHNGKEVRFTIAFINVITQPMGTMNRLIVNEKASAITTNTKLGQDSFGNLRETTFGIADFGNFTLDIEEVKNGSAITDSRDTIVGYGMRDIYGFLAKVVRKKTKVRHTAQSVEGFIDENWVFKDDEATCTLQNELDAYLAEKAPLLKNQIEQAFPELYKMKAIFLCGGGASVWYPHLKSIDTDNKFFLIPDAQTSNALGFLKLAHLTVEKVIK